MIIFIVISLLAVIFFFVGQSRDATQQWNKESLKNKELYNKLIEEVQEVNRLKSLPSVNFLTIKNNTKDGLFTLVESKRQCLTFRDSEGFEYSSIEPLLKERFVKQGLQADDVFKFKDTLFSIDLVLGENEKAFNITYINKVKE